MRYFVYSPIDMSEHEAYLLAKTQLEDNSVIEVRPNHSLRTVLLMPGQRPRAFKNTYLVRVEPDDSLRIIEKRLD
jgi:hypothetical protein